MPTPTTSTTLAAALWDFDGTLADTEPMWIAAEYDLINGLGHSWSTEHAEQMVGNSLLDSGAYILEVIGRPDLEPAWVVDELVTRVVRQLRESPVPWRPGALELLESLAAAGVPCALVSASYRVLLDAVLERLPADTFRTSVAGDEVTHGKPHPEPYQTACRNLGVDPSRCVVFEDSGTGARSGNAAGALVLAVENVVPVPPAERRTHVSSLADLTAADVARMLDEANLAG